MPENLNLADSIVSMLECLDIWTATLVEVATDVFRGGFAWLPPTRLIPTCRHPVPTPLDAHAFWTISHNGQLDAGGDRVRSGQALEVPQGSFGALDEQ